MVNLHELYLNTLATVLEANKLDVVHQPAGDKPAGVLWAMFPGTTKPELFITYYFQPIGVKFVVNTRDSGRTLGDGVAYAEGVERFLGELVKFINAGRLAAPKGKS